ncbi:MAG: hypothetical protein WC346_13130 [Methanogenium sp.]|jgi:hypothetical protein
MTNGDLDKINVKWQSLIRREKALTEELDRLEVAIDKQQAIISEFTEHLIAAGYRIDDNDNWYRRYDTQGNKITTDKFGCNKYTRDDTP